MVLTRIASLHDVPDPLELMDVPPPVPGAGELLIQVSACGVCHTELDEIEGRTAPPRLPVIPGHEVVGRVVGCGEGVTRVRVGDRVGVGWIHRSTGEPDENLSDAFEATGRDVPGGYAEFMTAPSGYSYPIPDAFSDTQAAPLLCAGAIGFRALRLTQLRDGDLLGLTGFGASAHLVLQLARFLYPQSPVHVFARDAAQRTLALELGAAWAGDTTQRAPSLLHAIIDTTPVWKPVVYALANLRPGGRLVINAIRKEDVDKDFLLQLSYHDHLWLEREIKSVANITRRDIADFLPLAARIPLRPHVTTYELADANRALRELKQGSTAGAKVLTIGAAGTL
ncbi:MAG: alcohol dehydrogenase catalytic domain-containing protein [Pirellulaceae bacterium]|nr:alcohol dehydrogenase catalytic domain-containing protein [Pirellulaceae bacterium]